VETSEATPRDHGDQSNDLETAHLTTVHAGTKYNLSLCMETFESSSVCVCVYYILYIYARARPTLRTCLRSDNQVNVVSRKPLYLFIDRALRN
jgi:hypothetical protein